jgi:UDP-N-acetylglucosamine 2-epimerase (non-hydrolysing)
MKVLCIVGARPNFMKIDPILRAFDRRPGRFESKLVHSGQHYDDAMSKIFFEELGIREPEVYMGVGSGSHAEQTAAVLVGIEKILLADRPDVVVTVGDVNSTMAATLAATKLLVPVAHVEAGLRSGDRTMPEEINRLVTDAISDFLFTPSRDGDENLLREGVAREKIHFVGNVMIDTLLRCRDLAGRSNVFAEMNVKKKGYALVTLHRPSNVDHRPSLAKLLSALRHIQERLDVIFPIHPRTAKRIAEHGFQADVDAMKRLRLVPPIGYIDFLALQSHAAMVLTDSGGIQEETTVLGVPCLTLRENTERPITISEGTNRLVGSDPERIVAEALAILDGPPRPGRIPEYWDGRAADRIADVLDRM